MAARLDYGGHDAALFPPPFAVLNALLMTIKDGSIFDHIQISLLRFFSGYLLAVVVAVIIGLAVGRLGKIWAVLDPIVQVLRPVSPIAWSPFIVLWFGIGNMPAIVIIFIAAFFPVLLSTVAAVKKSMLLTYGLQLISKCLILIYCEKLYFRRHFL